MPDDSSTIAIRMLSGLDEIAPEAWDSCADPGGEGPGRAENPFLTHRFLAALEESGSVSERAGWIPRHLVAETEDGEMVGVMPLYVKTHSQGEYVFDYGWADAFERAGGKYYPKLQCAVPFTPVPGRRVLARPGGPLPQETVERGMVQAAAQIAVENDLSSLHLTFCTDHEWAVGGRAGLLQRTDQQFHWRNHGYADFDDFLGALASRKRKQIRKERAQAVANGVTLHRITGGDLRTSHWDAFWRFYQDTGGRKWGMPYLNRAAFDLMHQRMADDVLLIMAERDGRWIAGALNLIGRDTLFGRYWGCIEDHPCLHFETCYYQAIDFAIEQGLATVEAGAQGSHKLARGYEPVTTRSLHYLPDPGFSRAVDDYLQRERRAVAAEGEALARMMPFRKGG